MTVLAALGFLTVAVFVLLALAEVVRSHGLARIELSRKISHIGSGVLMLLNPLFFASSRPVIFLGVSFALFLFVAVRLDLFPGTHGLPRRSYGTAYFAVAIGVLAALTYDRYLEIYLAAVAVLGFGDGLAGVIGSAFGRRRYTVGASVRSVEGTSTMLVVSYVAVVASLVGTGRTDPSHALVIALPVALLATAVEAVSPGGTDNLAVPGVTAAAMYLTLYGAPGREWDVAARVLACAAASTGLAFWRGLEVRDAVYAFLIGSALLAAGGIAWTAVALLAAGVGGRGTRDLVLPALAALGNAFAPSGAWFGLLAGSVAATVGTAGPPRAGRTLGAVAAVAALLLARAWLDPASGALEPPSLLAAAGGALAGLAIARRRPERAAGSEPRGVHPAAIVLTSPRNGARASGAHATHGGADA